MNLVHASLDVSGFAPRIGVNSHGYMTVGVLTLRWIMYVLLWSMVGVR